MSEQAESFSETGTAGERREADGEGVPTKSTTVRSADVPRRKGERVKSDVREVYFVRATTLGHIKIGVANNAWLRFMALDSSSPDPLELLGVIRSPEAEKLEASIHLRFAAVRIRREWFQASPDLTAFIADHARSRDEAFREELRLRGIARRASMSGRKPGWRERQAARLEQTANRPN